MKTYDLEYQGGYDFYRKMVEQPDEPPYMRGEWVRLEDAEAALAAKDAEIRALRDSLAQEIRGALKARSLWAPDNPADLIPAVAQALDAKDKRVAEWKARCAAAVAMVPDHANVGDLQAKTKKLREAPKRIAELEGALDAAVTEVTLARIKEAKKRGEERIPCYLSVEWVERVRALRGKGE
jgi:hypothetical protein